MADRVMEHIRVLLVDDDEDDAILTRRMLAGGQAGRFTVEWRQTSAAALETLRRDTYDIMLLDFQLGRDTGLDLLASVREEGIATPAILLTGHSAPSIDDSALKAGVVDHLEKTGLQSRELERAVRYAAERGRTERARLEALERERGARLEAEAARRRATSILESITEAFYAVDCEWIFTYVNPAGARLAKQTVPELLGHHLWTVVPGLNGTPIEQRYRAAMEHRSRDQFEAFYPPLSIWMSVHVYPWADGIAIYADDITARKAAEEEQARLSVMLMSERALFSEVLQQLPIGVVVADFPSGRLRSGNAEVERMWRHPFIPSSSLDRYAEWRGFHDDGRPYAATEWPMARTIRTGEAVVGETVRIMRGDGTPGTVRINSLIVHDSKGGALAAVVTLEDITQARQIEDALRFQARLLEVVSQAVIATDVTGHVTYWNRHAELLYGWAATEAIGRSIRDLTPNELTASQRTEILERLRRGQSWSGEFMIRHRDGHEFPVLATGSPILGHTGELVGIVGVSIDIIERRLAEGALRESEAFFRAAFASSAVASMLSSPRGEIIQANSSFCELLGYTDLELRSRSVTALTHREDVEKLLAVRESILGGAFETRQHEKRYIHRDGRIIDGLASLALVRRPDGAPLYFITQVIDMSDRKRAEMAERELVAERLRALEAVREREQYFRALIENASDPVLLVDADSVVTYASPAIERVTGIAPDAILGTATASLIHPDDGARMSETLDRVFTAPERSAFAEVRMRHHDGKWRTVRNTARNLLDDPTVGGIIVNVRDITDEKLLAQQLRQSQKLEAVGQLAGGVAHDFNNLLTVIKVHGEFLGAELDAQDPRREEVEGIAKAVDRAVGLTRQLLAFSRQQILQPKVMDLNASVTGLTPMLRRLIGEDITIETNPGAGAMSVLADPGQIEQVLMNLAINARDAMQGGGTLSIETSLVDLDDSYVIQHDVVVPGCYVMLSVSDTGIGMDQAIRERIFEPFFTTKEAGKGTGLGLSTVYGIVKQSNGYVWVYSEPGEGTTFKIYLPMVTWESTIEAPAAARPIAGGVETILLVEDEEAVRQLGRRILARQGYNVLEATNGAHALEIVAGYQGTIDVVVTDVVMPRMNGRELVERLRTISPTTKVLYTSGYTNDDILRRRALDPGAHRLLQKPFTANALAGAVREVLDAKS